MDKLATILAVALVAAAGCLGEPEDSRTCLDYVADYTDCFDEFCHREGAGSEMCRCYESGQRLDISSCECVGSLADSAYADCEFSGDPTFVGCPEMKDDLYMISDSCRRE